MDIFQKCEEFKRADEVKALGVYPYFRAIQENKGATVIIEGREVIMAGSNNYLGLTVHPEVRQAALDAIKKYGTGCSGSRYLNGTYDLHEELESELAEFFKKEAALLFTTGYKTAQGVLSALAGRGDYIVSDKDNHASIVAGTLISKAMGAKLVRYQTNDMDSLESALKSIPIDAPKIVITDGVYSMTGYIVNLPDLLKHAKKYKARVMVDEAHSIGVLGEGGLGTGSHYNVHDDVDMMMGTFSKSFASIGGFIVSKRSVVNYIKHHSMTLIFSASMPPASVAAVSAALKIMKREPERIERLRNIAKRMRSELKSLGFNLLEGQTPIIPVVIGDDIKTFNFWRALFDDGVFVNAVISPAVPQGLQLLRVSFMSILEDSHLDKIIASFKKIGKHLEVI